MDGIHSTGLGTRTLLLDNGIIWTGFQTLSTFDAFLDRSQTAVFQWIACLGQTSTRMFQTALAALCDNHTLLRTGVAGKFNNIDKGRLIIFLFDQAGFYALGKWRMLGNVSKRQSHCHTQSLSYDSSLQKNTVTICCNLSWKNFVRKIIHLFLNVALIGKPGNFSKNLVSDFLSLMSIVLSFFFLLML